MEKEYNFRKATIKDLPEFFKFFSHSVKNQFPHYSQRVRNIFVEKEYSLGALKAQFKRRQIDIFLAFYGQKVVGHLVVRDIAGGICEGAWLGVSDKHQKQGIATKLLKLWEKEAKKAGMHKLHLWTDKRNLNFYKNRGFNLVGMIPKNYYGADDYLFYKSIQKPLEKNYLKK